MKTRLKEARRASGLSQQEAADRFGVSIGTYRNWEQGRVVMNGEQLIDAANEYKVTVDYLLMMDSPDEGYEQEDELMQLFSKLNDTGRSKLIDYADDLVSSGKYGERAMPDYQVSGHQEAMSA